MLIYIPAWASEALKSEIEELRKKLERLPKNRHAKRRPHHPLYVKIKESREQGMGWADIANMFNIHVSVARNIFYRGNKK